MVASFHLSIGRFGAVLAGVAIIAATIALVGHIRFLSPPMVDDAGTSLAYAITFFHGHGLRLTPYSQAVEGFSNPLWVLLAGIAAWSSRPIDVVLALGAVLGVAGALAAAAWGPVAERRWPRLDDALPIALAASTTCFAYWISAGLETGLQVLLMSGLGLAVLDNRRAGPIAGVLAGLLALTRPEAALYAMVAGLVLAGRVASERRWPARREWLGVGAFTAIVAGYQLLRLDWFASWLPNTYYAKAGWDFQAANYLGGFARQYVYLVVGALALGAIGLLRARTRARAALALGFIAAGAFFAWFAHGDWMHEWRFLAPLIPSAGAAMAAGISALREMAARRSARELRVATSAASVAVMLAVVFATARVSLPRSRSMKAGPEFSVEYVAHWAEGVQGWLSTVGIRHALIATPDLGGNSLTLREAELIDDAGLADYAMARDLPHHAAREDYLLSEGPPDLVNAHGPSGDVARYHRLLSQYEFRHGDYVLRGLTRDVDPRCPNGKPAVLAMSSDALGNAVKADLNADRPGDALRLWRCAFRYQPESALPTWDWRQEASRSAVARADSLEKAQPELALRFLSFATVLGGGDAWLRRRTEKLRVSLFP